MLEDEELFRRHVLQFALELWVRSPIVRFYALLRLASCMLQVDRHLGSLQRPYLCPVGTPFGFPLSGVGMDQLQPFSFANRDTKFVDRR